MWVRNNYATSLGIYLFQRIRRIQNRCKETATRASGGRMFPVSPGSESPSKSADVARSGPRCACIRRRHSCPSRRWGSLAAVGCHLLHKLAIRSLDLTSPSSLPIFLPLPRDTGMKVVNSLKSLEKRDKNCRIVRRKGRIYVINKPIPGSKPARADPGARLHDQLS